MRLKDRAELSDFLEAVSGCGGSVCFQTDDGDSIDLKSVLSKFLFAMIATNPNYLKEGRVVCSDEKSYEKLSEYLEAEQ